MDTAVIVAITTSVTGILTAGLSLWANRRTEQSRSEAERTRNQIELAALEVERWEKLMAAQVAEIERLNRLQDDLRDELAAERKRRRGDAGG